MEKELLSVTMDKFSTHVPLNKKRSKWMKIGFNRIYSGMNFHLRNLVVSHMHEYISSCIPAGVKPLRPGLRCKLIVKVPKNFGNIRRVKGKLSWKKPPKDHRPNWDLENLANIWIKCINDTLVGREVIPDDTVGVISGISYEFVECEEFEDRELVYKIYEHVNDEKSSRQNDV